MRTIVLSNWLGVPPPPPLLAATLPCAPGPHEGMLRSSLTCPSSCLLFGAPQPLQQQMRGTAHNAGIAVDVPNGNVDRAWKMLTRKLRSESYMQSAQSRE